MKTNIKLKRLKEINKEIDKLCLCNENPSGVCIGCVQRQIIKEKRQTAEEIFDKLDKLWNHYTDTYVSIYRKDVEKLKKEFLGKGFLRKSSSAEVKALKE